MKTFTVWPRGARPPTLKSLLTFRSSSTGIFLSGTRCPSSAARGTRAASLAVGESSCRRRRLRPGPPTRARYGACPTTCSRGRRTSRPRRFPARRCKLELYGSLSDSSPLGGGGVKRSLARERAAGARAAGSAFAAAADAPAQEASTKTPTKAPQAPGRPPTRGRRATPPHDPRQPKHGDDDDLQPSDDDEASNLTSLRVDVRGPRYLRTGELYYRSTRCRLGSLER